MSIRSQRYRSLLTTKIEMGEARDYGRTQEPQEGTTWKMDGGKTDGPTKDNVGGENYLI